MTQPTTPATGQTQATGDPREPESAQTTEKPHKYYPKTLEAIQLVNAGVSPEMALKFSNQKDSIRPETVSRFKQKLKKHSLTQPKLVKSAHEQIKRILEADVRSIPQQKVTKDGQVVNYIESITPSDSNILAAAAMVYDRFEPAKQPGDGSGSGLTVNIIPIAAQEIIDRMTSWKTRQVEGNVIDVQPETQTQPQNVEIMTT